MRTLTAILLLLASLPVFAGGEPPSDSGAKYKVVYQCNKGEPSDYKSLLFSVSQLKEKYGDDVDIVVTCLGKGIHLLAKHPRRGVPETALEQMIYLDTFGVKFHACGNTMNALGWHKEDMHDFVEVVPIGADDLMQLQHQGYSYLAW
jgi:intracellular sulfur oxidation DsrE/DsrF family protein